MPVASFVASHIIDDRWENRNPVRLPAGVYVSVLAFGAAGLQFMSHA